MKKDEINLSWINTLLQIDGKAYEQYRSTYQFLKPFNIMMALHTHDLEKHLAWQYHEIAKELGKDHEVTQMYQKLIDAVDILSSAMWSGTWTNADRKAKHRNKTLEKYSDNIIHVLSDNHLILSTNSERLIKEEVGNKAFKLWQMSKAGLPVPPAFFLTFAATRMSYIGADDDKMKIVPGILEDIMYYFKGKPVAIRSSGLVSMPGQLETIYVKDSSDYDEVCKAIGEVISSWYNEKAVKYRKVCKIDDLMQIGIVIQLLVDAEKGFSGSAYSRNPLTGEAGLNGEVLHNEMGAQLANGEKTPEDIKTIPSNFYNELSSYVEKLEEKFRTPQYVEFASDGEKLYMLQTRDAKVSDFARGTIGIEYYKKGWMDSTRLERLYSDLKFKDDDSLKVFKANGTLIAKGIAASTGIVTGRVTFKNTSNSSSSVKDILFTDITTPHDLWRIKHIDGVVTSKGGYTSHPADICRTFEKPAIVSANIEIFDDYVIMNKKKYVEGDIITIVGNNGEIYDGNVEVKDEFVLDKEFKNALKQ